MVSKSILFLRASSGWKDPSPPMAFSYLGAIAKQEGFEVFVENLNAQYSEATIEGVIALIKREKPIIGISIFTNYSRDAYDLISKIRDYCEVIVAGGPHVTIYPEEVLEKGADVAIVGEAEAVFGNLINSVFDGKGLNKVKGVVFRDNGRVVRTESPEIVDLDKIQMPDKEIHRKSDYIKIKEEINNFGGILSSRGCPGRCTYCYHSLFGKCFRYRSAENVFEEMKYLYEKYGITHINFIDDAFTVNRGRLMRLCDLLIDSRLGLEWVCATRIDYLDRDIIFKMKEAGCVMISLGVESCIPKTLIKMKKTGNAKWYIQHSENVLKWCKEAGIRAGVNILTGFPWDSVEDIKKLQEYVIWMRPYVTQNFCGGVLQPLPCTEVYDNYAKQYGFEKWWLKSDGFFKDDYHPFFMLYYHPFWEQLHNNFFKLDGRVFREIDKLYRIMGKWNLWVITKRRFGGSLGGFFVYLGLVGLSKLSLFLFNVSPRIEKRLMKGLEKFSYRFKYKE